MVQLILTEHLQNSDRVGIASSVVCKNLRGERCEGKISGYAVSCAASFWQDVLQPGSLEVEQAPILIP